jgi:hypothetical protein
MSGDFRKPRKPGSKHSSPRPASPVIVLRIIPKTQRGRISRTNSRNSTVKEKNGHGKIPQLQYSRQQEPASYWDFSSSPSFGLPFPHPNEFLSNPESEDHKDGIGSLVKSIIQSAFEIVRDRARLIKLEAHSAGSSIRKIGWLTVIGIITFTCGYSLLLWLGIRLASARWFDGHIEPALAIIGGIHIFTGGLCLLAARVRSRRARFFRNSLTEINRDRKWLKSIKDKLKSKT